MNRLLLSGLIAVCSASSASSAVVEVLNDAKGTYTYSVAPTSGADATKTSVSFDRVGTNWSGVGALVDDKAMYSISALIREFPEAPGVDGGSMSYFPGDVHGGNLTITFELDSAMTATEFFVQVAKADQWDAFPDSITYSISDNGTNGISLVSCSWPTARPLRMSARSTTRWFWMLRSRPSG